MFDGYDFFQKKVCCTFNRLYKGFPNDFSIGSKGCHVAARKKILLFLFYF